jgi:hypothetical protein
VDDHKRGGDIDLLVRPPPSAANQPFAKKIKMLGLLERLLGERKIDLVMEQPGDSRPIVTVAHPTGIQIQSHPHPNNWRCSKFLAYAKATPMH